MTFYHLDRSKVRCPRCQSKMVPAKAIQGGPSTDWLKCSQTNCHTYYDTWIPMPHQAYLLRDDAKRLGIFGGYGSGKTATSEKSDEKHILITANGETLIGADTLVQLENTLKKDFERTFPDDFVRRYQKQKNLITFHNGHTLYYRPLAEQGDLRSYNLTRAHILEASEVKHDSYVQLQTRLRNTAAIRYETHEDGTPITVYDSKSRTLKKKEKYNWIQMIVESNPDSGWIKDDFLLRSGRIHLHYDKDQKYHLNPLYTSPHMSSHIIPSKANVYLPEDFIPSLEQGKPKWWVKRYLYGSFDYAEGLVYPHFTDQIISSFDIPKHWPRIISMDYGLNDNTHFLFGAIDFNAEKFAKPAVFYYHEIVINNASVSEIATVYKDTLRRLLPANSLYKIPVMDARSHSQRSRTGEKKTLGTLFREEGCFFKPAQMDLDARILRTNNFIDQQHIYFFEEGVPHLIEEAKKYKYPDKKIERITKADRPIDKDNHGINALEFAVMELPHRLKQSSTKVYGADPMKQSHTPWGPQSKDSGFQGFGELFEVNHNDGW